MVLSIILGGGRGSRLYPLTKERAKPAVPFGGKYRLVDIPLSNCIHSGFKQIYILTQFNSVSLHNHVANTYIFDSFGGGFVKILAAEQTFERSSWYKGTADAVRQNFSHFYPQDPSHYLILAGDQLLRMDLSDFYRRHRDSGADISVAVAPVAKKRTDSFGILEIDKNGRVVHFVEKPAPDTEISNFEIAPGLTSAGKDGDYLASMGIYIFNADILAKALDNDFADFGREVIPDCINRFRVQSYIFEGFWEDIGTIRSFYETNINLTSVVPNFNFYDEKNPIYTHRRDLPPSKINQSVITATLTADGCIITKAELEHSIVGVRTVIEAGARLNGVFCMGSDFYETEEQKKVNREQGIPNIGIGAGSWINRAIIDINVRIGQNCRLGLSGTELENGEFEFYHVHDGIIIIPKSATVPSGTII
ncbi:MAG TPA: glucose-1-phosphate adenylyltransferase [bacterium]|nr:glucose-1-phosphate adenylyltransferase [bacterium]